MNKNFSAINAVLVITVIFLSVLSIFTWTHPKNSFPKIGNSKTTVQKKAVKFSLNRHSQSLKMVSFVAQGNLFQEQRKKYKQPFHMDQVAYNPVVPPPNLKLNGVILLRGKKIALLKGTYPVAAGQNSIKNIPLKRKIFSLGSQIGGYELTHIGKSAVRLDNRKGIILNLKLVKNPLDKKIQPNETDQKEAINHSPPSETSLSRISPLILREPGVLNYLESVEE